MAQKKEFKKIAVLTSGGDAPGMNAAVRAVVNCAISNGVEVVGSVGGYRGLMENTLKKLSPREVANISLESGTVIYSDRALRFKEPEGMAAALKVCKEEGIDGVIAIGGDGTFRGATDLTNHGIPTIGIPGTIDNDITASGYTIGFDTAMNTVLAMVDRLHDTCESHARCNVVEVMGRGAGDIALYTAMASGAVAVAIPEVPFDEAACIEKIKKLRAAGQRSFIVIVSEGIPDVTVIEDGYVVEEDGETRVRAKKDVDNEIKKGKFAGKIVENIKIRKEVKFAELLAKKIQAETHFGEKGYEDAGVETKFARLAHVVRGGEPTLRDRVAAARFGVRAVEELLAGNSDIVVIEQNGEVETVDINYALVLDRMWKKTLKDGDLEKFTAEQVEAMKAFCENKQAYFDKMYSIVNEITQ